MNNKKDVIKAIVLFAVVVVIVIGFVGYSLFVR